MRGSGGRKWSLLLYVVPQGTIRAPHLCMLSSPGVISKLLNVRDRGSIHFMRSLKCYMKITLTYPPSREYRFKAPATWVTPPGPRLRARSLAPTSPIIIYFTCWQDIPERNVSIVLCFKCSFFPLMHWGNVSISLSLRRCEMKKE